MKLKTALLMIGFLLTTELANAAIMCPSDSCNPANGCMDGCGAQEKTCGPGGDVVCAGKEVYSKCSKSYNQQYTIQGYCSPTSVYLPADCHCG